ncbi:hypothetical protein I6F26_24790 [Ensifer sp. IC3342]|nr:hypothetical protein [Ensifer sp. BRP08]MCA1449780.1 hypothetical protein [Ensifer sp. IC3342]
MGQAPAGPILATLGTQDRGLNRGYDSASALDIPSALIEPFFGDNPADAQKVHTKKDALAEAIARAPRLSSASSEMRTTATDSPRGGW